MILYLVRHGIAGPAPPGGADEERMLTADGARLVGEAGRALRRAGVRPSRLLTSPWLRARQTAEVLHEVLAAGCGIEVSASLRPDAEPAELAAELAAFPVESAMCVSHMPHVARALAWFLHGPGSPETGFSAGAIARVDFSSAPRVKSGSLAWLAPAEFLAALGRATGADR